MTLSYILPALADRTLASLTYQDCYAYIAALRVYGGTQEAAPATKHRWPRSYASCWPTPRRPASRGATPLPAFRPDGVSGDGEL